MRPPTSPFCRRIQCAAALLLVLLAATSAAAAAATTATEAEAADTTLRPQFGATTEAPKVDAQKQPIDEENEEVGDLGDFEDTVPDDAAVPVQDTSSVGSGLESAAVGLGRVLDVFETLTTVWRTVNARTLGAEPKNATTASSEARYIKGDPLKGYYDFIITEGSYKFWAVFQLLTAALMIYSTFAAIYYSKVNPIVSDYDYTSYLGGRSLGAASGAARSIGADDSGAHPLSSLLQAGWMGSAAQGFEWVMEAIEKRPT